jgi:putative membrane protein
MTSAFHLESLLNAIFYAILGVVLLVASFVIWDKMTPYNLWKEIVEDKNVALAIVVGAMALGIAIIVAAAVH